MLSVVDDPFSSQETYDGLLAVARTELYRRRLSPHLSLDVVHQVYLDFREIDWDPDLDSPAIIHAWLRNRVANVIRGIAGRRPFAGDLWESAADASLDALADRDVQVTQG